MDSRTAEARLFVLTRSVIPTLLAILVFILAQTIWISWRSFTAYVGDNHSKKAYCYLGDCIDCQSVTIIVDFYTNIHGESSSAQHVNTWNNLTNIPRKFNEIFVISSTKQLIVLALFSYRKNYIGAASTRDFVEGKSKSKSSSLQRAADRYGPLYFLTTTIWPWHYIVIVGLSVLLFVSSCLLGYAFHRNRHVVMASDGTLNPGDIEARVRQDPSLGSTVTLRELHDLEGHSVPAGENGLVLLFVAGPKLSNCSTCGTEEFIIEVNSFARSETLFLTYVVWAGQKDLAGLDPGRSLYNSISFALDPKLTVAKRLNCFLFPRVYVVSSSGRLMYISPIGEEAREVIKQIREVIAMER